ncbi:MAG: protein kinase [Prevotellaceae bacterium]|jgi:serine/threonine protein kinase|nr:protein kinase [Prevotellaceae bacterium]
MENENNKDIIYKDYEKLNMLGEGSFATVFMVKHHKLGYIRAIRVLNRYVDSEHSDIYKKFLEECIVLLRLGNGGHPNIVRIYQPMLKEHKALVEMDYVKGKDVFHYIKEQHHFVPAHEVVRFVQDMSSALAYCHVDIYEYCMDREEDHLQDDPDDGSKVLIDDVTRKQLIEKYQVIHNDIHAGNIIRKDDGSYILLDFGLAIQENKGVIRSSKRKGGVPEYKAPEKWEDDGAITTQSDIYSLGILMYEMLTGDVPFTVMSKSDAAIFELMEKHRTATPPPIEPLRRAAFEATHPGETYKKDYPDWLEAVIRKCLAKKPQNRFADGRALCDEVTIRIKQAASSAISLDTFNQEVLKNRELQRKITELTQQNQTAVNQYTLLETAKRRIEAEKQTLSIEIKSWERIMEEERTASQKKIASLNSTIMGLSAEKTKLENELKNSKSADAQPYVEQIKALKSENALLSDVKQQLMQQVTDAKQQQQSAQKELTAAIASHKRELNSCKTELTSRLTTSREENERLKKQLATRGSGNAKAVVTAIVMMVLFAAGAYYYYNHIQKEYTLNNDVVNTALTRENEALKDSVALYKKEIRSLKNTRSANNSTLSGKVNELTTTNQSLQQQNESQQQQIEKLQQQLNAEKSRTSTLQKEVSKKEQAIRELLKE